MRKVVLNVSKLGLAVGDTVKVELINSVGKPFIAPSGYTINSDIQIVSNLLEIELLENEVMPYITSYKLLLTSGISFTFTVPLLLDGEKPHDLITLLSIGCTYGVIDSVTGALDNGFLEKLNLYYLGENPRFSNVQKEIVRIYEYYADEIIDTYYTIDVMEKMDEYLSTLIGDIYA